MNDDRYVPYAALMLRLTLGAMFIAHGLLKVLVFTLPGTAQFFESVGFSGWMAYPVVGAELFGGLLLVLGVATRWVSLALVPVLLGAAYVHLGNGWVFSNANGGWEFPVLLVFVTLVQAMLGAGALAVRLPPLGRTEGVTA